MWGGWFGQKWWLCAPPEVKFFSPRFAQKPQAAAQGDGFFFLKILNLIIEEEKEIFFPLVGLSIRREKRDTLQILLKKQREKKDTRISP